MNSASRAAVFLLLSSSVILGQALRQGITYNLAENTAGTYPDGVGYSGVSSSDGHYVLFDSEASDLVPNDTNDMLDVFVRNTWTGALIRISQTSAGVESDGESIVGDISPNGRYVVFATNATNLGGTDNNGSLPDIYYVDLYNWQQGTGNPTITRVTNYDDASFQPTIAHSPGELFVAFVSSATNIVTGDTNGSDDVFVKRVIGAPGVKRVSVRYNGAQTTTGYAYEAAISSNGSFLVYTSDATNLVSGFSNNTGNSLVYFVGLAAFLTTGWTPSVQCVSKSTAGTAANDWCWSPKVSNYGYTVYVSGATNLVTGDTNSCSDVFYKNVVAGQPIIRITVGPGGSEVGEEWNDGAGSVDISDLGSPAIVFDTDVAGLVPNDTNEVSDVFISKTAQILRLGDWAGDELYLGGFNPTVSADGQHVVFFSCDENLPAVDPYGESYGLFVCDLNRAAWLVGAPMVGSTVTVKFKCAEDAGLGYVAAASTEYLPGFPLDGIRRVPLIPDALFYFTSSPSPYWPGGGTTTVAAHWDPGFGDIAISIPSAGGLSGFTFYVAFATLDPASVNGVRGITNAVRVAIP